MAEEMQCEVHLRGFDDPLVGIVSFEEPIFGRELFDHHPIDIGELKREGFEATIAEKWHFTFTAREELSPAMREALEELKRRGGLQTRIEERRDGLLIPIPVRD